MWGPWFCGDTTIGSGESVPRTVQECMNTYDLGTVELERCLQWVEEQDDYLGTQE